MRQLASLDAWKVARQVAVAGYRLTLKRPISRDFALADQIRRAAVSVPANLVEGYALGTRRQLIRHVRIALASCAELRTHFDPAGELELVEGSAKRAMLAQWERLICILVGLLKRLGARVPVRRRTR